MAGPRIGDTVIEQPVARSGVECTLYMCVCAALQMDLFVDRSVVLVLSRVQTAHVAHVLCSAHVAGRRKDTEQPCWWGVTPAQCNMQSLRVLHTYIHVTPVAIIPEGHQAGHSLMSKERLSNSSI